MEQKGMLWRGLIVLLSLTVIFCVVIAMYAAADLQTFGGWLGIFGLAGFFELILLEIVRRTALYLIYNKSFFHKKIPKALLAIILFFGVATAIGIGVTWGYEKPHAHTEAKKEYEMAKQELPHAKALADQCHKNETQNNAPNTGASCPLYRQTKLDYDACREYSSPAQCLALYDYQSVSCWGGSFVPISTCDTAVDTLQTTIDAYELAHP